MKYKQIFTLFLVLISISLISAIDISSCTNITSPGNYQLTNDIICPGNYYPIVIKSSDVYLDGNGYSISGNNELSTNIQVWKDTFPTHLSNVTIKNLNLKDTGLFGIQISDLSNSLIDNLNFTNVNGGIGFYNLQNTIVSNNNFHVLSRPLFFTTGVPVANNQFNLFYNNKVFYSTTEPILIDQLGFNFWNQSIGNYWANPSGTGYSQICNDTNNDFICDEPYTIYLNNIDYMPIKDNVYPSISINLENKTYSYKNSTLNVVIDSSDNYGVKDVWYNWNGTNITYNSPIDIDFPINQSIKFDYSVRDLDNLVTNKSFEFFISPNNKPFIELPNQTNYSINEFENLTFYLNASDPDNDSLNYSWYLNGELNSSDINYNFLTDYSSSGNYSLIGYVSDGELNNSIEYLIEVVNTPYCGDSVIDSGEDCSTCSLDCGDCPVTSSGGGGGGGGSIIVIKPKTNQTINSKNNTITNDTEENIPKESIDTIKELPKEAKNDKEVKDNIIGYGIDKIKKTAIYLVEWTGKWFKFTWDKIKGWF